MKKILYGHQVVEHEFTSNLFYFMKYFNMLDYGVGRCIANIQDYNNPTASYSSLSKLTIHSKMIKLEELILSKRSDLNEEVTNKFIQWFDQASELRLVRNSYVHGYWDLILDKSKPIVYIPSLWNTDKRIHMSIEEFKVSVHKMKIVYNEFFQIKESLERLN